jgi:hypothetical protein
LLVRNAEQLSGNNHSEGTPPNSLNTTFDYISLLPDKVNLYGKGKPGILIVVKGKK